MATVTGFTEVVQAVRDAIGDDSVFFGSDFRDLDRIKGDARCVVFVPRSGQHQQPRRQGNVEIEDGFVANPMYEALFNVDAHIRGESWDVTYLLWCNILNAVRNTYGGDGRLTVGRFEFVTQSRAGAAHKHRDSQYVVQEFAWTIPLYKGLVRLPPCNQPVQEFIYKRHLVPMRSFTVEGEYVDYAEMPPGPPPPPVPDEPDETEDTDASGQEDP